MLLAGCGRKTSPPPVSQGTYFSSVPARLGTAQVTLSGAVKFQSQLRALCTPVLARAGSAKAGEAVGQEFLAWGSGVSLSVVSPSTRVLGQQPPGTALMTLIQSLGSGSVRQFIGDKASVIEYGADFASLSVRGELREIGREPRTFVSVSLQCP